MSYESHSTTRFSNRVDNYVRYRPGYPDALPAQLEQDGILRSGMQIADIGSGTGISTALFLKKGYPVFAVEPNGDMRRKAEEQLGSLPGFSSINGTAEQTTLPDNSADLIIAGQAFHWFDREKTRAEFRRISRPGAYAALFWNLRLTDTPFAREYEKLLQRFGTDYKQVGHKEMASEDKIAAFFAPEPYLVRTFDNEQHFDFEGLKGRLLSSSYAPEAGHPEHLPMLDELKRLYDRYAASGIVRFGYTTVLYAGKIN
ncbi:class I SAM-dependent methyltransferase [Compostibacter hankyongensis]|uniref:Class I SAM-dependent methyltransferase n=1 Tax=Compostibacter hankyongensis TaxID=1007089 RepID=A0ABP8FBY2_9BACT